MGFGVVYFIWVNEKKDYMTIINGQLADIVDSGILSNSKIHIVVSCEKPELYINIEESVSEILMGLDFEIEFHEKNLYEYYGINKLWKLAQADPARPYLYLHAKGMSDAYNNESSRHRYEVFLTRNTLGFYREAMNIFESDEGVQKIGLFPSALYPNKDFVWLNFYYASGKYLITCEQPVISDNRYYYETWSGTGDSNGDKGVYNISENNYKKYDGDEFREILNRKTKN